MTKPKELPITPKSIPELRESLTMIACDAADYGLQNAARDIREVVSHLADHTVMVERLEEARRLLLAIATHSEQAGNDNVRGADLRLSTPSINAFLTRTKQPEE